MCCCWKIIKIFDAGSWLLLLIFRKIVAGAVLENASFSIEMLLFRNESLTTELEADDVVCVPDYIYVVVALDIDSSNTRFFVQV